MKKIITLFAVFLLNIIANAQSSFQVLDPDNSQFDITNNTIDLWGDLTTDIQKELIVKNISAATKSVKLKRVFVSGFNTTLPNQDTVVICWNQCLPASWNFTQTAGIVSISANSVANYSTTGMGFHSTFSPCSLLGTRVVRYTFWDNNNSNDSVSVVVNYHITAVGLSENKVKLFHFSAPQPNPASGYTAIKYDFPFQTKAQLKIFNIAGTTVREINIDDTTGKINVDIENLPNGIYFYSLVVNDKVIGTKKLIISQ